jgi:uncharacterized membrane protein
MTRQEFMSRLRAGLAGLPATAIVDIADDYEAHFNEGQAAGRSEAEVAAALGDPARLARELRAEAGLKAWQETRSPSTAAAAVFAVLGLGAIDLIILLPILMALSGALFGVFMGAAAGFAGGAVLLVGGPFFVSAGHILAVMLAGLGLMAGSAAVGAVVTLLTIAMVNALVWYGRLHFRLLKPAIEA